jgi:hypothetical protein
MVELDKREKARKKNKRAPGSGAEGGAKKKKSDERAAFSAENAKRAQAVMGREVLSDQQRKELGKKFPKALEAKKSPSCCMQRR